MPRIAVEALAKVNLGLYVLYRRPDQFHELRTVFQTISLSDRVEVSYEQGRGRQVGLSCNVPELAHPGNLAAKAAALLLDVTRHSGRVTIRLEKRIPVGAGLGGGSSDAAAVLRALGSLLRRRPQDGLLLELAGELGSDVPFFLGGGRAVGIGRGTECYPLPDHPPQWMVVVAPATAVSTAEAYRRLSPDLTQGRWEAKIVRFCSRICTLERGSDDLENDFEPVVFRMVPELASLKARLQKLGARPALLCGSGSALFGVFGNRRQAIRARESLKLEDGRSFVVRTVNRSGYRSRWERWLCSRID